MIMKQKHLLMVLFTFITFTLTVPLLATAENGNTFDGRKLFITYCYLCHGANGSGDGPLAEKLKVSPTNLLRSESLKSRSDVELIAIIDGTQSHNLVTSEMPQWGKILSKQKIRNLFSYVRFLSQSKYPLAGNPEVGAEIYSQYCSACHGKRGRGMGTLTMLLPIKPADHSNGNEMAKLTNVQLMEIISNGAGANLLMPAWKDVLKHSEIRDLVGYIRLLPNKWGIAQNNLIK